MDGELILLISWRIRKARLRVEAFCPANKRDGGRSGSEREQTIKGIGLRGSCQGSPVEAARKRYVRTGAN